MGFRETEGVARLAVDTMRWRGCPGNRRELSSSSEGGVGCVLVSTPGCLLASVLLPLAHLNAEALASKGPSDDFC